MTEPPFHYPHDEGQPPTEQFAMPLPQPTFWQRYRAALVAAGVVVALLIGGVVWAVAASSDSGDPAAAPPPPSSSAPKSDAKHHAGTRGTVTAEDGDTWTVQTEKGDTVSVTINADTKFGTAKEPVDKAKIAVHSKVVVQGKASDGKVDARRIRLQAAP